jgi:uncharacterized LabA/DUF88 family protein
MDTTRRLALLIDGDNAQAALLPQMLTEVNKYGMATIRRVYGDWTEPQMKGWKEALNVYALQLVQQFRYTKGKNATDSALIIDAMDILYTAGIDGFCLVSSDSDFTRLATRIREKNLFVMGIGKESTPRPFIDACNVFVYTENLMPPVEAPNGSTAKPAANQAADKARASKDTRALKKLLPLSNWRCRTMVGLLSRLWAAFCASSIPALTHVLTDTDNFCSSSKHIPESSKSKMSHRAATCPSTMCE